MTTNFGQSSYSVLDLGFDRTLTKPTNLDIPTDMKSVFSEGVSASQLGSQAVGGTISLGHQYISIDPSKDPQVEIDKINASGGGRIRITSTAGGIIRPASDLVLPAGITLEGDSETGCIIDFGNTSNHIIINGADVTLNNFTVRNSSNSAVYNGGYDNIIVSNMTISGCVMGFDYINVDQITFENMVISSPTSIGVKFNNCSNMGLRDFVVTTPGTYGFHIIDSDAMTFIGWSVVTAGGGGVLISGSDNISMFSGGVPNTVGIGIECSATNTNINIDGIVITGSSSDGIKFTATTDRSFVRNCTLINNGGYGINIAASTCDDNNLLDNYFASNTSGAINDAGVGTIIR